jgi:ATPase subunit of ABC transporter with duplicated ATPase domains
MILSVDIEEKSFGDKLLYAGLQFEVQPREKVGLIGRNGTGKSTLFRMILGDDTDYQGEIITKRGITIVSSRQEHHGLEEQTVLEYIQGDLPEYARLSHIIDTYPAHMHESDQRMQTYADALDRFSQLGYFEVEDHLSQVFEAYQLDPAALHMHMKDLSGGQKRMVELVKVQRSRGHLALIDEPTNHMDYVAKRAFVKWLAAADEAVVVITHDRDVLREVDRIIEVRDGRAFAFRGNYEQYLKTNTNQITSRVNEYDLTQRRIVNLRENVIRFQRMKEKARDPGTIRRFKSQEMQARTELAELEQAEKPSFWIDQESAVGLNEKMTVAYQKYKAQNIRLDARAGATEGSGERLVIQVDKLALGYGDEPLFEDISFSLHEGGRMRLHGRNGAGKTTLVDAIMAKAEDRPAAARRFKGHVMVEREMKIGRYEQEIDEKYLPMQLRLAIEAVLRDKDMPISDQRVNMLLGNYLFNPQTDGNMPVSQLSGGQKARFQLISMLADEPQILILDEPTNHLDLPSIEELENALTAYNGAIIYISHDSYFANKLGGDTVAIGPEA